MSPDNEDKYESAEKPSRLPPGWWRPAILVVFVLLMMFLAWYYGLGDELLAIRSWIAGQGNLAPLVYMGIYIVETVLAGPEIPMVVIGGVLFGPVAGVVLSSTAATISSAIAFLISRYFARDALESMLMKNKSFRKLERMTVEHGAIVVAIMRLQPVLPFALINYGFGLTEVGFWTYVFWSWLCMFPVIILYTLAADVLVGFLIKGEIVWWVVAVMGGIFLVLLLAVWLLARHHKSKSSKK